VANLAKRQPLGGSHLDGGFATAPRGAGAVHQSVWLLNARGLGERVLTGLAPLYETAAPLRGIARNIASDPGICQPPMGVQVAPGRPRLNVRENQC
jgi:hypothetical protein